MIYLISHGRPDLPRYDYKCARCGYEFEQTEVVIRNGKSLCPECRSGIRKPVDICFWCGSQFQQDVSGGWPIVFPEPGPWREEGVLCPECFGYDGNGGYILPQWIEGTQRKSEKLWQEEFRAASWSPRRFH